MRKEPPFLAAIWYWFAGALFLFGLGIVLYQAIYWLRFEQWPPIPIYVVFGMAPLWELDWSKQLLAWLHAPADRRILHTLVAPVLNLPVGVLIMALSTLPFALASWLHALLEERQRTLLQRRRAARTPTAKRDKRDPFPN